jgi:hypothetical protein
MTAPEPELIMPCACCGNPRGRKAGKFCDACSMEIWREAQHLYKAARRQAIVNVRQRHIDDGAAPNSAAWLAAMQPNGGAP